MKFAIDFRLSQCLLSIKKAGQSPLAPLPTLFGAGE